MYTAYLNMLDSLDDRSGNVFILNSFFNCAIK